MIDWDVLREAFRNRVGTSPKLTRRHVIDLADFFGVSPRRLVHECEDAGLAPRGSWRWFESEGGITEDHIWEARLLRDIGAADERVDTRGLRGVN